MMRSSPSAFLTDGIKSIPLSQLSPEAWTPVDDLDDGTRVMTVRRAHSRVPILYRAIDIRANAVARMPFRLERGGKDVTNDDALRPLIARIRLLLYLTEAALCCYNQAYWELGTNRVGKNITPFWLSPLSVRPDLDMTATNPDQAIRGFDRSGAVAQRLTPDQMCWFWGPSILTEIGPDPTQAPVAVVLQAAGLLEYLSLYAINYFRRGGVKMTLLTVEGNPPPQEKEKLKTWWDRMVRGVQSAFQSAVISASVKPTILGSDPGETASPELTKLSREDIAIGMGIPVSLLMSNALAGGTATAERLTFYDTTIVPRCDSTIDEPINDRFLLRLGLRLLFTPEKLEVYQASELQKADSLMKLTGNQAILTVDEARERLGLEPLPKPPAPPAAPLPIPDSSSPLLDIVANPEEPLVKALDLRAADLDRWQRKALKRLKGDKPAVCTFQSDQIEPEAIGVVTTALETAQTPAAVKAAFLKAEPGEDLTEAERKLYLNLLRVLRRYEPAVIDTILQGGQVDLSRLSDDLRTALLTDLTTAALNAIETAVETINGVPVDLAQAATLVNQWSQAYVNELGRKLDDTTRTVIEQASQAYVTHPGMSRAALAQLLAPAFGARRADTIAVTEVTRSQNVAQKQYQAYLADNGLTFIRVWQTANDDRTCLRCSPLNGKSEEEWRDAFPDGGPAHARCRCTTTLRYHPSATQG